MFEDFENRSGFWKNLGSNYTINYSGNAPSFMSSGEMWQSMDNSETQTLAAWENGWVLMDNPDGSKTATPKYTSGLLTQTIVRVPVGPTSPNSSPMGGMGGVVVTGYGAETKKFASSISAPTGVVAKSTDFKEYYTMYQNGDKDIDEQPFKELLISGTDEEDGGDQYHWSEGQGGSRLDLHNNNIANCGNLEFVVNEGWTLEVYIKTGNADYFNDNLSDSAKDLDTLDTSGMTDWDSKLYVLMEGGDKLSLDICDDYSTTAQFYITSKGVSIDDGSPADFDDWTIVDLQNVWYKETEEPNGNGDPDDDGGADDGTDDDTAAGDETNWLLYGGMALVGFLIMKGI